MGPDGRKRCWKRGRALMMSTKCTVRLKYLETQNGWCARGSLCVRATSDARSVLVKMEHKGSRLGVVAGKLTNRVGRVGGSILIQRRRYLMHEPPTSLGKMRPRSSSQVCHRNRCDRNYNLRYVGLGLQPTLPFVLFRVPVARGEGMMPNTFLSIFQIVV